VQRKIHLVDYPPWDEDENFNPGETLSAFDTAIGRTSDS